MQVIHDVAPGASLAFYTAENGESGFANGIAALAANANAKVIVNDVGYFDEPFFQDGVMAQAIDKVVAQGVAYFSAAGNDGSNAYENTAPSFSTLSTTAPTSGEYLLNFDNSGATKVTTLSIGIPALQQGELVALVLQWDQPYVTGASGSPGASSHLNMCVTGSGNDKIINLSGTAVTCTGPNSTRRRSCSDTDCQQSCECCLSDCYRDDQRVHRSCRRDGCARSRQTGRRG